MQLYDLHPSRDHGIVQGGGAPFAMTNVGVCSGFEKEPGHGDVSLPAGDVENACAKPVRGIGAYLAKRKQRPGACGIVTADDVYEGFIYLSRGCGWSGRLRGRENDRRQDDPQAEGGGLGSAHTLTLASATFRRPAKRGGDSPRQGCQAASRSRHALYIRG